MRTDPEGIIESIYVRCVTFLTINSNGDNTGLIARQFAQDIFETRPDWKTEDIDYFFKFIRQRQDIPECKIFGNKITGIKLMELAVIYEDYKSQERERMIKEQASFKLPSEDFNPTMTSKEIADHIQKIIKDIGEKRQEPKVSHVHQTEEVKQHQQAVAETDFNALNMDIKIHMGDFDREWDVKKLRSYTGVRVIRRGNNFITQAEYVNQKLSGL